jgi:hypothetical protein
MDDELTLLHPPGSAQSHRSTLATSFVEEPFTLADL